MKYIHHLRWKLLVCAVISLLIGSEKWDIAYSQGIGPVGGIGSVGQGGGQVGGTGPISHDDTGPAAYGAGPAGQSAAADSSSLHVLFIGNSLTFVQNVPQQVARIAASDPGNPTKLIVTSAAVPNADLQQLWDNGQALTLLRDSHWDYVVLQEHSNWTREAATMDKAYHYADAFSKAIRQAGAMPVVYLTWTDKPGSRWYDAGSYSGHVHNSYALAERIGASVAPVGPYWHLIASQEPGIELYAKDGHHAAPAGGYVAALVIYKTLTQRDGTLATFRPGGVSAETAAKIKSIVAGPAP